MRFFSNVLYKIYILKIVNIKFKVFECVSENSPSSAKVQEGVFETAKNKQGLRDNLFPQNNSSSSLVGLAAKLANWPLFVKSHDLANFFRPPHSLYILL